MCKTPKDPVANFLGLKKPCENCPFRKVGAIELQPGRIAGIVEHLLDSDWASFSCHKTVTTNSIENEDGKHAPSPKEKMCAGAMIYLQKVRRLSVPMRLGAVQGWYDMAAMEKQFNDIIEPDDVRADGMTVESEN